MNTFRSKKMCYSEASLYLRRFYYALEHHRDKLLMQFEKDLVDPDGDITWVKYGVKGNISGMHQVHFDPENGKPIAFIIKINPSRRRYGSLPKVFIHELLHHIEPDWNEEQVVMHENLIYEALTNRQLWNLMRKIFTLY